MFVKLRGLVSPSKKGTFNHPLLKETHWFPPNIPLFRLPDLKQRVFLFCGGVFPILKADPGSGTTQSGPENPQ